MSETTSKKNVKAKRRLFGDQSEDQAEITQATSSEMGYDHDTTHVATVLETPQKKQKFHHDFFSPKEKPVVTPDKVDDDEVDVLTSPTTSPHKKPRLSLLYSPPQRQPQPQQQQQYQNATKTVVDDHHIPTYIHKNLSYKRKGTASLPLKVQATFELVQDYYDIPVDFEQSRFYGPLSGTSHEERVICAYNLSLLEPKKGKHVEICSSCVKVGHKRNDCPDLV